MSQLTPTGRRKAGASAVQDDAVRPARLAFAAYLREARVARDLTLGDVAAVTKIPSRTLDLLEAGRFDDLPADVFLKGFVRSYARTVGIDEDDAVERYQACGKGAPASILPPSLESRRAAAPRAEGRPAAVRAALPSLATLLEPPSPEPITPVEPRADPVSSAAAPSTPVVVAEAVEAPAEGSKPVRARRAPRKRAVTAGEAVAAAFADSIAPGAVDAALTDAADGASTSKPARPRRTRAAVDGAVPRKRKPKAATGGLVTDGAAPAVVWSWSAGTAQGFATTPSTSMAPTSAVPMPEQLDLTWAASSGQFAAADMAAEPGAGASDAVDAHTPDTTVGERIDAAPLSLARLVQARQRSLDEGGPVVRRVVPTLTIDDDHPEQAETERAQRDLAESLDRERGRASFLPPILREQERQGRQGGLTLAVIILLIAATLTLSYLMRSPGAGGDGFTARPSTELQRG